MIRGPPAGPGYPGKYRPENFCCTISSGVRFVVWYIHGPLAGNRRPLDRERIVKRYSNGC